MPEPVRAHGDELRGRSMLVKRTDVFPVECVVRGYITGSGRKDYQRTGEVCGHKLPAGLRDSEKLSQSIFTPATKAETGHDENISEQQMAEIVGEDVMKTLRDVSLRLIPKPVTTRARAASSSPTRSSNSGAIETAKSL